MHSILVYRTKIAIKTSRTSDKSKETVLTQAYDEDSDVSTDDEQGAPDEAREETPDLYRNSSLGMCVAAHITLDLLLIILRIGILG